MRVSQDAPCTLETTMAVRSACCLATKGKDNDMGFRHTLIIVWYFVQEAGMRLADARTADARTQEHA